MQDSSSTPDEASPAIKPSEADHRDEWLTAAARDAGDRWAADCRAELAREGREVEGGWPGTIREARMRVAAHVGQALVDRSMVAMSYDELGRAARVTYDKARRSWLSMPRPRPRRARRTQA
jgi:hypothetical protein